MDHDTEELNRALAQRVIEGIMSIVLAFTIILLLVLGIVDFPALRMRGFPLYFIPCALVVFGTFMFWRAKIPQEGWGAAAGASLLLAILWMYFMPILSWWMQAKFSLYLTVNLLCFTLTSIALAVALNLVSSKAARFIGLDIQALDFYYAAWLSGIMLSVPLIWALCLIIPDLLRDGSLPFDQMNLALQPHQIGILILLPLTLPLMSLMRVGWGLRQYTQSFETAEPEIIDEESSLNNS